MTTPEEPQRNGLQSGWKYAGAVVLAAAIYGFLVYHYAGDGRGTFGDMFGGLNAVFAGWAFVALVIALSMQREELGLQRKELELTRQELGKQAHAMEVAAKLQALSALLVSCEARITEAKSRARHEAGIPFPSAGLEAVTYEPVRRECLHWIHRTLREEFRITIPFPEKTE